MLDTSFTTWSTVIVLVCVGGAPRAGAPGAGAYLVGKTWFILVHHAPVLHHPHSIIPWGLHQAAARPTVAAVLRHQPRGGWTVDLPTPWVRPGLVLGLLVHWQRGGLLGHGRVWVGWRRVACRRAL